MPANFVRISLVVLCPLALSCGGGDGPPVSVGATCFVSSVTVTPSTASLAVGASTPLNASVTSTNCTPQPAVGWESTAANVATVSNTGVVTGVAAGTATVRATTGGQSGTAAITVSVPVASVTLTAPAQTVLVGGSLQALAQAKDAAGNVLAGRTFTWQTSNATVATVSNAGLVTGVIAGTVTITVSSEGRTAQLAVTVNGTGSLTITSITPTASSANVAIDTPIRIQFSATLDAATVSASTVRVTVGGTAVTGTLAVSGNTVTFTPAVPLTEFATIYTVTVTTGVLSSVGNFLAAQAVSTFTTVFFDAAYYYRITNQSTGSTQSLDTFANTFQCFMGNNSTASGQSWYFTPVPGVAGGYTMKNQFQGDTRALEGADGTTACLLTTVQTTGIATGQIWLFSAVSQFPNTYRLQNVFLGTARSLDAFVTGGQASPRMALTANTAAQAWSFSRLQKR